MSSYETVKRWKLTHPEEAKRRAGIYYQRYRAKLKLEVFSYYGGSPPQCACCGEKNMSFLSLDHINGGGKAHRRQIGGSGAGCNIYRWLRARHYPRGFQVLCYNCNSAKHIFGICPHQAIK